MLIKNTKFFITVQRKTGMKDDSLDKKAEESPQREDHIHQHRETTYVTNTFSWMLAIAPIETFYRDKLPHSPPQTQYKR